jgi:tetratricopeptide (TPR) repeat protein
VEQVDHTVITAADASNAYDVLRRAELALSEERFDEALAEYDKLLRADAAAPDATTLEERAWRAQAWLGAGTVHDLRGEREEALRHYLGVVARFGDHELARHAEVRAVRLLVHLERLDEAAALARRALQEKSPGAPQPVDRGPLAEVALLSAVALDLAARGDDVGAMRYVARGQQVIEGHGFDQADALPRDLAQLYFALGEVRRLRAERITFDPTPPDFPQRLEERCQLLLDAQSAYSDAMRAHDAHWSAMAGYRVGELYQRLHEDLMLVKPPSAADTESRRALFEGAMRLRYSILLSKSRTMLEHTLRMIERTAHETRWAEKARAAHRAILAAIDREEAALARLPYSRGELEAALEHLARQAPSRPGPSP